MQNILNSLKELLSSEADISIKDNMVKTAFIAILAIMTYIITMSMAGTFITNSMVDEKVNNNTYGSMTVEFFGTDGDVSGVLTNKQKNDVLKTLKDYPGVKSAKLIDDETMRNMMEKWLPGVEIPSDMPLPTLFCIDLSGAKTINSADLSTAMSKINKNVRVYDHTVINNDAVKINSMFKMGTMLLAIIAILMVCATIFYFTNSIATSNLNTVKILNHVGASKNYICRQLKTLNFSVFVKSLGWSFCAILASLSIIYGVLSPINFFEYWLTCVLLLFTIPVTMTLVVVVVTELSATRFVESHLS